MSSFRLLVLSLVLLVGCGALQEGILDGGSTDSSGPTCDGDEDGKQWDLGTGYAQDIRRTAPGFLALRPDGWRMPEQPFLADQAVREQSRFAKKNQRRLQAIDLGNLEIERERAQVDDIEAFDLVTKPIASYRIRKFRVLEETAIMVTPGTCPHLFATDTCEDGRLRTRVTITGPLKCVGPFSTPDHLMLAFDERGEKIRLDLGKPLIVDTKTGPFFMFDPEGKPMGKAERQADFSDALPDEVLATLTLVTEQPAAVLYKNVASELLTPEVKEKIARARIDAVKAVASNAKGSEAAYGLATTHLMNGTLPGDDEVAEIIRPKLIEGAMSLEGPTSENFRLGLKLIRAIRVFKGNDLDVTASGIEDRFGPLLADGTLADENDRKAFLAAFPESPHSVKLKELLTKEIELAEAGAKKRRATMEIEDAWLEVEGRGDEIATLAYKIKFGHENFTKTRHNQRGLASMQKYRDGLVRDAFCPAKRAFVKAAGAAEYNRRAAEHCKDEAPTDVGVGGVQKTLTAECRAAFATGC